MIKTVLAQIDPTAGDVKGNAEKIIEFVKKAKGSDLIIFPELSLMGYPFGDIFIRYPDIIKRQYKELERIKQNTKGICALVGFVEKTDKNSKKPYYNSVAIINDTKIEKIARKTLLPSYCEFNDTRYFESCNDQPTTFTIKDKKFGVVICEDGWADPEFFDNVLYSNDPVERVVKEKIDILINCSSSPSRAKKEQLKHNLFSCVAKKHKIYYINVNQSGYGDNLSYDGASRIYSPNGDLLARAQYFNEDFLETTDFKGNISKIPIGLDKTYDEKKVFTLEYGYDLDRTYKSVINAVRGYFKKTGFSRAVLGLSGGLDSSVCAALMCEAIGKENVWGVSMPTHITTSQSLKDGEELAKNLGLNFQTIPIAQILNNFNAPLSEAFENIEAPKCSPSTTFENLQARIRATILWSISNEHKSMIPIATSDKSELYLGYATINGDMSGGFAPIADITKTKLFALAKYINKDKEIIPQSVLDKPPGAELKINKETNLPVYAEEENMPYEFLDEMIWLVENLNYGQEELLNHGYLYEKKSPCQKELWVKRFLNKTRAAIFKWHLLPPSVIIDSHSINLKEYRHPIISSFF